MSTMAVSVYWDTSAFHCQAPVNTVTKSGLHTRGQTLRSDGVSNSLAGFCSMGLRLLTKTRQLSSIQDIHERMMRFQKLTRNLFLTLHGHNVHCQFLMRHQQSASHARLRENFNESIWTYADITHFWFMPATNVRDVSCYPLYRTY